MEQEFEFKTYEIENKYKKKIRNLEKENSHLYKIIDKFEQTIERFIYWICRKFDIAEEDELVREFEYEMDSSFDPTKQIESEEKEWDFER